MDCSPLDWVLQRQPHFWAHHHWITAPLAPAPPVQRNQFNYSERAAQTYTNPLKTRVISTLPPETGRTAGNMTQWALMDA